MIASSSCHKEYLYKIHPADVELFHSGQIWGADGPNSRGTIKAENQTIFASNLTKTVSGH